MGSGPKGSTAVTYGDYALTMRLPQQIDMQRLLVTRQTCATVLATRSDIPPGLKRLITELFERGAIVQCSISYGDRMDLQLARQNARGNLLLIGGALDHFSAIFAEITGQQVAATWQPSGGRAGGNRTSPSIDSGAFLGVLARVIDAVSDGVQLAAAIKILTND